MMSHTEISGVTYGDVYEIASERVFMSKRKICVSTYMLMKAQNSPRETSKRHKSKSESELTQVRIEPYAPSELSAFC
jgi:hypothetical protein